MATPARPNRKPVRWLIALPGLGGLGGLGYAIRSLAVDGKPSIGLWVVSAVLVLGSLGLTAFNVWTEYRTSERQLDNDKLLFERYSVVVEKMTAEFAPRTADDIAEVSDAMARFFAVTQRDSKKSLTDKLHRQLYARKEPDPPDKSAGQG